MKIRMKVAVSGTRNGRPWPAYGEVAEVSDAEGADLCAAGMAEPVADPPAAKAEQATPPPAEKRTTRQQRPRGKRA